MATRKTHRTSVKVILGGADAAHLGIAIRAAPERNQIDRNSGLRNLVLPPERYIYVEKGDLGAISHCYLFPLS